jgi:hypothetical protein
MLTDQPEPMLDLVGDTEVTDALALDTRERTLELREARHHDALPLGHATHDTYGVVPRGRKVVLPNPLPTSKHKPGGRARR